MSKKLYRLKKEILNYSTGHVIPIGESFEIDDDTNQCQNKNGWVMSRGALENADFFEEVISEPKKKRIEVVIKDSSFTDMGIYVEFKRTIAPREKYPAIKAAIETVLNDKSEDNIEFPKCGICGGATVRIRGKYPKSDYRFTCPTCTHERLEQVNEISSNQYGAKTTTHD